MCKKLFSTLLAVTFLVATAACEGNQYVHDDLDDAETQDLVIPNDSLGGAEDDTPMVSDTLATDAL
ncbi:MAG: hypothetical protein WBA12_05695 [Catalinimonas sp.]